MKFVQAKWFHTGRRKKIRLIVIHCTVSPESPTGAEAVAAYFARGERRASAHRVGDNNSVVQCVLDSDTAFAAAGANSDGLHYELVGQASQSAAEWGDEYSIDEMYMAIPTMREWGTEYNIPFRWLTVDEVADGVTRGFCTHADVSRAFPDVSTGHWDPGPNFPKSMAMAIWRPIIKPPTPIPPEDDDMAVKFVQIDNDKAGAMVWPDGRIFDRSHAKYVQRKASLYAVFSDYNASQREVDEAQDFINNVVHPTP